MPVVGKQELVAKGWELAAVRVNPSVLETDAGTTAEHTSFRWVLVAPCGPDLRGEQH